MIVRGLFVSGPLVLVPDKTHSRASSLLQGFAVLRVLLNGALLLGAILLTRNRLQVDLDPTVLRPAIGVTVAGNGAIRTGATGLRLAPLTPWDVR